MLIRLLTQLLSSFSNQVRKKYDARKLKWDNKLERYAKKWAKGCKFEHSHGEPLSTASRRA